MTYIVGPPLAGGLGRPEVNASGATPCGWPVCSLVCLFAGLFVRWPALAGLFVRWSVCLLAGVGWSVCSLVCLLAGRRWLVCLYLYRNDIMPGQCVSAPHLFVRRRRWWREF